VLPLSKPATGNYPPPGYAHEQSKPAAEGKKRRRQSKLSKLAKCFLMSEFSAKNILKKWHRPV